MSAEPAAAAAPATNPIAPRRLAIGGILKEAFLTAIVALVLAIPLVGFRIVESGGTTGLRTRFWWVAIATGAVFAGRLALGLWRGAMPPRAVTGASWFDPVARYGRRHARLAAAAGIAVALALPALPYASRSVVDLATTVIIYVMLGWGLNVVVGLAGLLDLGYVAFYAVGAYSFALLAHDLGFTFWEALPLSGLLAATAGVLLGFPVLRLRGDYLAIVTLGFGEIIHILLLNWTSLTYGPNGIGDIPRPGLFGLVFERRAPPGFTTFHDFLGVPFNPSQRIDFLYYLVLALALIVNLFTLRLRRLPIGRAWEALREDEIACRALGINPVNVKLSAFGIGAMLGGFAGAFFATRQGFISPESFTFTESATILAIVVLGGMGSQMGVVLAALLLVVLPELGRGFAEFRMLIFGAAMVGIMVWRPQGLLARREPSLRLHPRGDGP
ncbi:MAG TPA: high-affinity branched-chain amino acid ABC transporter permease LivM [Stellaceae bacterium]